MQAMQRRCAPDAYVVQGRTVTMPAVVRDASSGNAVFLVPSAAAQPLVGDAFEVVEMAPGQTQLILGFVDYRDNDLGDYNEVMMIFVVRPRGKPGEPEGTFIYKLPVNQSFTCEAGRTIWGFPKSVEQIDVDYGDRHVTCKLVMDGQHVFTLTVPRGKADGDTPDMEMATYTYLDGPTVVRFTTGGPTAVAPGGDGVQLTLGTHPLADELRQLGLPAPATMSTWMEHMHGSFGMPRTL
ncbi:MAG TPA: acetoacetate decarboxylase family protein [Candidatus Margulisiibacteriota bacterium]|nr:acetoacetate decarboxylase family protein [Candidatus Margulisiibacteriota bacterium]